MNKHSKLVEAVINYVSISVSFFLLFVAMSNVRLAEASSTSTITGTDFSSGYFDGTENYSRTGEINLKSAGTWGPRTWKTPNVPFTVGSVVVSDGTYIYNLEATGVEFYRYDPNSNTWETLTAADHSTYYGADLVVVGNYIYAIFGGYQKTFSRYSIIDDTWTDMSDMLDWVYRGGSLTTDGTDIYASRGNTADFYKYTVSTDTWSVLPDFPNTFYYGAVLEYHNGYIYSPRGANSNLFYRFNISTQTWSQMANAPDTLYYDTSSSAVKGIYIYYMKGNADYVFMRYNTSNNTWETLTNLPQASRYGASVYNESDDQIYVFRGNGTYDFWKYDDEHNLFLGPSDLPAYAGTGADLIYYNNYYYYLRGRAQLSLYRYSANTDTWSNLANAPATFNDDTKGTLANGILYFYHGGNTTDFYSYNIATNTWSTLAVTPVAIGYGGTLTYVSGDYIYGTRGATTRTFMRYSISGNSWDDASVSDIPDDGEADYGARLVNDGTDIYYISGSKTSSLFKYVIATDTWSEVTSLKFAPYYGTDVAYYNGKLYITSGYLKDDFWEYTISNNTWRALEPVDEYYGYDYGSYNGASLETDGAGNFYFFHGWDKQNLFLYTSSVNNYLVNGTWTSDVQDLTSVSSWTSLTSVTTTPSDSTVSFETRSSVDQITWSAWEAVSSGTIASPARRYIQIRATLTSSTDRSQKPTLHSVTITYTGDESDPSNPDTFNATSREVAGVSLTSGSTYNYDHPYFSWSGASDDASGVAGYYVYFGTNISADPETDGYYQTSSNFVVTAPLSENTYYLRIKTVDVMGNVSSAVTGFTYVYLGVPYSSITLTNSADFNMGTTENVSTTNDQIKLSSKEGFWLEETLSNAPSGMYGTNKMAYVASTGKLYQLRGYNTTTFYEYDISSDTWTTLAAAPGNVYFGGGVVEGPSGYLYAFRGYNTSDFWRYNISTNEWSDGDAVDSPQTIYYGGSLEFDGSRYIYAFRGNNDDSFMQYDTVNNSWESMTNVDFGAPVTVLSNTVYAGGDLAFDGNDTIYAIQGNTYTGFSSYSISTNTWTPLTPTPVMVYTGGRLEYNSSSNAVYLLPGWGQLYFYKYSISTGTWTRVSDIPASTSYGTALRSVGENIYALRGGGASTFYKYNTSKDSWLIPTMGIFGPVFRGSGARGASSGADMVKGDSNYFYMMRGNSDDLFSRYDSSTGDYTLLESIPASVYLGGSMVFDSVNNKIYVNPGYYDRSFYIYDIATNTWDEITTDPPPFDSYYGSSMVFDGSRYIYWTRGSNTTTFYKYDTQGSPGARWTQLANVTAGVHYGSQLVYKDGYIYTMRGANVLDNPLYKYDPVANSWTTLSPLTGYRIYNDGFLIDGGGDYLYACRATNTKECFKYSISGDSWSTITNSPAQIYSGGAGASDGIGKLLVMPGAGSNAYADGLYTYIMQTSTTSFEEEGTYTSPTHDLTSVYRFANLSLTYTSATNTDLIVYTRTSNNGTDWSSWTLASENKVIGTTYSYKTNSSANRYIQVKFSMESSDGIYSGAISDYTINYYQDTTSPTNPSELDSYSDSGMGTEISTNTWYYHTAPHFDWPNAEYVGGASDSSTGSGVIGYYTYFGTNSSADPVLLGTLVSDSEYTASSLITGSTYYLRIKPLDDAGNVSDSVWQPFIYKFDTTSPDAPSGLAADPSGYSAIDSFDFSWDTASDTGSGVYQYCYKTGASSGDYSADQCTSSTSVSNIPSYQSGTNIFYVRTKDTAGNYSSYSTVSYYYSGTAPSAPQSLAVTPATNTSNSFAFSWSAPSLYFGSQQNIIYHYSINALPTALSTQSTTSKSLSASSYASLPGSNTFYIVAEDEAGNVDYGVYSYITFTANTTAPGIPTQIDIADVSVKATESWKLAISWEAPSYTGSGVSSYKIYRSTDDSTYSEIANTSGISYVDTNLTQVTYYYKVKACDSANNCGPLTSSVSYLPDGKFIVAAPLVGEPAVSGITTRSATITWTTSRTSDSKVAYGTASEDYIDEEVSSSTHVTSHTITLSNLSPGSTYYFVAKWTDEDGNTGISDEYSFDTEPAPSVKEVSATNISLTTANIKFTSKDGSLAKIYYGETTAFGGFKEIGIASSETTYTVPLEGLKDGVKYYYKVNLFDIEDEEYEGDTYSFNTLPRPQISDLKISQIKGLAQTTVYISWITNTDVSSVVTYYPTSNPTQVKDVSDVSLKSGKHQVVLPGLEPQSSYTIIVSGKDRVGNETSFAPQTFTTSSDTRAPQILDIKIEGTIIATGKNEEKYAQLIVSWKTDEDATSQVEFGEGSGTTYSQKTQEDSNLAKTHLVVISNLVPSRVYHLRVVSKDSVENIGKSIDSVTITPRATENALDLVVGNLSEVFGFLGATK